MLGKFWLSLGGVVAVAALMAAPAVAKTIHVHEGESIQGAVNHAVPGDVIVVHPGVYRESVLVKRSHLTLRGAGPTSDGAVIEPSASEKQCNDGKFGICIGRHKNRQGNKVATRGTHVSGFLVRGFEDFGAIAFHAKRTVFRHNAFLHDGEYGAAAFGSRRTRFINNRAKDADEAGFYIGDSPRDRTHLRGNVARHNGEFGIFIRDASRGVVTGNRVRGNCLGIGLVNSGSPGGAHRWTVKDNDVNKNNRFCPGGEEGPPISGTGIGLIGASDNKIRHNHVFRNRPAKPSAFAPGGIVLISSEFLGGTPPSRNTIARNRAFHNKPADIIDDGSGSGNTFPNNHCGTSQPPGLCG